MIYLLRVVNRSIQIAVCEDEKRAAKRIAQGYKVVTQAEYIDAWKERDWPTTMEAPLDAQPKDRAVGDPYSSDPPPKLTRLFRKKG